MTVVDEDGRLFGRINVFDALVVSVVLFVVLVAGAAALLAAGEDGGEAATRYATVDLGDQSPAVAERISTGDAALGGDVAVTDVYVGPAGAGNVTVVVRARVDGTLRSAGGGGERAFEYRGQPLQEGDDLGVETATYDVDGAVLELSASGETLDTGTLGVVVETALPAATRSYVDAGDAYTLDGREAATVEETVFPPAATDAGRTDLVGLSLRTIAHSGGTYFGDAEVRLGTSIDFRTAQYAFSGEVVRWGSTAPAGERTTTNATIVLRDLDPEVADGIRAGMVERRGGAVTARVTAERTAPATVVLTGENGSIHEREHPRKVDVTLAVELRTRTTDAGLRFHARSLQEGSNVTLDLGRITVTGTVTSLGE